MISFVCEIQIYDRKQLNKSNRLFDFLNSDNPISSFSLIIKIEKEHLKFENLVCKKKNMTSQYLIHFVPEIQICNRKHKVE